MICLIQTATYIRFFIISYSFLYIIFVQQGYLKLFHNSYFIKDIKTVVSQEVNLKN